MGAARLSRAERGGSGAALTVVLEESLGARAALVFEECFDCFEAAHPRTQDHYHLGLLGTHTEHRGAGIGMDLLRDNLAHLDALGMPAYLASTNPANLRAIARGSFGFAALRGHSTCPTEGRG